ncbi:hypothetical protein [Clostridium sp.]|uniref:hypothetical protein n=1 Tax=Clostridium sp. TaxID=1506 RepID=UPI002FCB93D7
MYLKLVSRLMIIVLIVISLVGISMPWFFNEGYLGYIMGYDYLNIGMAVGYLIIIPCQFMRNRSDSIEMLNFIGYIIITLSVIYIPLTLLDWEMTNINFIKVLKTIINPGYKITLASLLGILMVYIFNYVKRRI